MFDNKDLTSNLIRAVLTAYRGEETPDFIVKRVLEEKEVQEILNQKPHKPIYNSRPSWVYYDITSEDLERLKPIAREIEERVEFWSKICKDLGRDVDEFSRDAMKEAKRESRALAWLRRYWYGETTFRTMPEELSFDIDMIASKVTNPKESED